jgi:uncharacterized protein YegP (UPF0339 family)
MCSFGLCVFNGCLQDDSNPGNVVLFNTTTGEYRFCCNGELVATGNGTVSKQGCIFTIQHNTQDRRVLIKVDLAVKKGTASIQNPSGTLKCTIGDRNITNNTCNCSGGVPVGATGLSVLVLGILLTGWVAFVVYRSKRFCYRNGGSGF